MRDDGIDLDALIACPSCDALHRRSSLSRGQVARCVRCHAVLQTAKPRSVDRVVPAALAALVAYGVAVTQPFVGVSQSGFANAITVPDAVTVLWADGMGVLSVLLFGFLLAFPLWVIVSMLLVAVPLRLGRPVPRYAAAEVKVIGTLAPWAMAEIFLVGTAVSLVKVAGLADIAFGPAFYALGASVLFIAAAYAFWCEDTVWRTIRTAKAGRTARTAPDA